jgi:hypothetical protein
MDINYKNRIKYNILSTLFFFIFTPFSVGPTIKIYEEEGILKGAIKNLLIFLIFCFLLRFLIFFNYVEKYYIFLIQILIDLFLFIIFVILFSIFVKIIIKKTKSYILKILIISLFPLIFFIVLFILKDKIWGDLFFGNFSNIINSLPINSNESKFFKEIIDNINFFINYIFPKIVLPLSILFGYLIFQNVCFYEIDEKNSSLNSISSFNLNNLYSWGFLVCFYIFIFLLFILKLKNELVEIFLYNILFGVAILFCFQGLSVIFYKIENSNLDLKIIKNIKIIFLFIFISLVLSSIYLFILFFFIIFAIGILENIFHWKDKLKVGGIK